MRQCLLICSLIACTMACIGLLGGCCGGGGCGCGRKKRSADVEWLGQSGQNNEFLCNSAHLRNILNETISTRQSSSEASKIALMTRLHAEGENSAVIVCSSQPFSYALPQHAEYCSHANPDTMCYVFVL